ncbi:hypothetical protein [Sphingobium fluviale]|uniref:Lipoprotein n=1 Tax=Sphingobium fluviale TaxID=2506423 RepID=A0A4Q1KJK9_9SPHN|nr:hypothetical protein [Sphingobium fluviale]RXR29540.1 hypothetical protein EQG66_06210 [Sphingobium fluviale]
MQLRLKKHFFALGCLAALAACVSPETNIRRGLVDAGLNAAMAQCMAKPMAQQLSTQQLLKLRSFSKSKERNPGNVRQGSLSLGDVVNGMYALNDPEIVAIVAAAALQCTLSAK